MTSLIYLTRILGVTAVEESSSESSLLGQRPDLLSVKSSKSKMVSIRLILMHMLCRCHNFCTLPTRVPILRLSKLVRNTVVKGVQQRNNMKMIRMRCRIVSFQLQTMRLVIPGVFFLTLGQIGSGALESNSNEERRFMYQNQPSKSHQLPFDQGVQIHIQRVLALCEFHYCDALWFGLFYFISAIFWLFFPNLANANFG